MTHTNRHMTEPPALDPLADELPATNSTDSSPVIAALLGLLFVGLVAIAGYFTGAHMHRPASPPAPPVQQGTACIAPTRAGDKLIITIELAGPRLVARCSPLTDWRAPERIKQ